MVSNPSKLLDEARERLSPTLAARPRFTRRPPASRLARPLGLSEEGSPGPTPFRKMAAGMALEQTPVAQGEETLQVTVSVTWAIKQAGQ